ncbi:prolyl 4-hydroxylase [Sporothrix schenckii 1099-18]|uniref:Prolyl 4-hydroxylase alpha subunit domain-containing protein n=2 Tax=Sporothrix schenckii TaxID=29908 RepID=U7PVX7_SPOS1|nr:prolyl 4-hydroxylase [Sporothrix schenckii 1099-18]ERS99757.1 hypothetical protein HMPREF1624_03121 [Sporothrix schenckii ATCC 58251]KJR85866.1 prolyl 4-hydroxylase [Sporothrix schenckii 1099-18]
MFGYAALVCLAAVLFWLDPILRVVAPSVLDAPVLRKTPRPPINEALLALEDDSLETEDLTCPDDAYTVHIFSKAPLVLYVENFLSLAERRHLIEISAPIYEASTVTHDGGGTVQRNATVRDSEVAVVPRTDVVRCIEGRARRLQGWRDDLWIERLRVQRYQAPSGHYSYHYDWSRSGAATGGWGRVSSLMVFVDDGSLDDSVDGREAVPLQGGGTAFPRLPRRSTDRRWCAFIGCGRGRGTDTDNTGHGADDAGADDAEYSSTDNSTGVVFLPVVGNAVFWENFRPDSTGRAYEETWHAGLRVRQGVKVGLNIWSWGRVD